MRVTGVLGNPQIAPMGTLFDAVAACDACLFVNDFENAVDDFLMAP